MRFLLDTNVLISAENPAEPVYGDLTDFIRLAQTNGHALVYHEASLRDFHRDRNQERRERNLQCIRKYECLRQFPTCPRNTPDTDENDAVDNEILHAISLDAAHYVVTEDGDMLKNARNWGLKDRVFGILEAASFLKRLYERAFIQLPNITEVPLHGLTAELDHPFFDSLKEGYPEFPEWFRKSAKAGRRAWIHRDQDDALGGLCIYAEQQGEPITKEGLKLDGVALKLCTFKVGDTHRGRKMGELFLKGAFHYATRNQIPYIFLTTQPDKHQRLVEMVEDFGFTQVGTHRGDAVYLKQQPVVAPTPEGDPLDYHRAYYPHFVDDERVRKFLIPIKPHYHDTLFPDFPKPGVQHPPLFTMGPENPVGNAIKQAYLCHANTTHMEPGDLVLFYRSQDMQQVTTVGVVESARFMTEPDKIACAVKRRTVYDMNEITELAEHGRVKVILFRVVKHLPRPVSGFDLEMRGVVKGVPQSITKITHQAYLTLKDLARA